MKIRSFRFTIFIYAVVHFFHLFPFFLPSNLSQCLTKNQEAFFTISLIPDLFSPSSINNCLVTSPFHNLIKKLVRSPNQTELYFSPKRIFEKIHKNRSWKQSGKDFHLLLYKVHLKSLKPDQMSVAAVHKCQVI